MSLPGRGCAEIARDVISGTSSAAQIAEAAFDRAREINAWSDGLNIILHADEPGLIKDLRAGSGGDVLRGKLAGVPIAVKDNIATTKLPTSCGSRILEGYVSPYEATVIRRLKAEGATVLCKTNMDEFAMGSSNENSAYGPVRNPHDVTRVPGGSSGGSAAAVAAGIVPMSLGSETGGSVRQPAAFCGVVGVKPTYGRVSRYGLVAFASSLDQVGVFGRSVDDAAVGMQVISGRDEFDSTSSDEKVPEYREAAALSLKGIVIGRPREYFPDSLDQKMRDRCDLALEQLRSLGATVRDVSLPSTDLAIPVYYIVAPAEASSNLARFDGVRYGLRAGAGSGLRQMYETTRSEGFGREVIRRIMLGTYVLSAGYYDAYYRKAQAARTLIAQDFKKVFADGVHALFTPTTPTPAFKIGAVTEPYEMYLNDIFTATANLSGNPAMSVPIGRVSGLPVGGQIIAPHFGEYDMFRVAFALERALGDEAHL